MITRTLIDIKKVIKKGPDGLLIVFCNLNDFCEFLRYLYHHAESFQYLNYQISTVSVSKNVILDDRIYDVKQVRVLYNNLSVYLKSNRCLEFYDLLFDSPLSKHMIIEREDKEDNS